MPTPKKQRSTFWVVSTHVLTAGFAMPFFGAILAIPVLIVFALQPVQGFIVILAFQAIGYIGGLFQSLSYIRKVAIHPDPMRCVKPAIIFFLVWQVIGLALNVFNVLLTWQDQKQLLVTFLIAVPVFHIVVTVIFINVTKHGFRALAMEQQEDLTAGSK